MKTLLPNNSNNKKGFTLIELLVVISILAVLATIAFAIYSQLGAQAKARNITRRSDLESIAKALEANKPSNAANYAVLAATQFSNNTIPNKDPQGNEYCANNVASTQPTDITAPLPWTTCASITTPASGYGVVGTTNPPAGTVWKICTYLEAETNPVKAASLICKLSAQ